MLAVGFTNFYFSQKEGKIRKVMGVFLYYWENLISTNFLAIDERANVDSLNTYIILWKNDHTSSENIMYVEIFIGRH